MTARPILSAFCVLAGLAAIAPAARAMEIPSFMQAGDVFCTSQADFDDLVAHGHPRAGSAIETCVTVMRPTRVAVLGGQGGAKSMVRVANGPYAYEVGWTNSRLPIAR